MDYALIGEALSVVMFFGVVGILMLGFPVAFPLAGTSPLFAGLGWLAGVFSFTNFALLALRCFGPRINVVLLAVPLFIFMGVVLERSRIPEALLRPMGRLFGPFRGALGRRWDERR